jgi:hypothetical protein
MELIYTVARENTNSMQSQIMSWKSVQCEYLKLGLIEDAERVGQYVKRLEDVFQESINLRNNAKLHAPKKKNMWNFGLKPVTMKF